MQVLAVDLLNPAPAAEARKHKLKVRFPLDFSSKDTDPREAGGVVSCAFQCPAALIPTDAAYQ